MLSACKTLSMKHHHVDGAKKSKQSQHDDREFPPALSPMSLIQAVRNKLMDSPIQMSDVICEMLLGTKVEEPLVNELVLAVAHLVLQVHSVAKLDAALAHSAAKLDATLADGLLNVSDAALQVARQSRMRPLSSLFCSSDMITMQLLLQLKTKGLTEIFHFPNGQLLARRRCRNQRSSYLF